MKIALISNVIPGCCIVKKKMYINKTYSHSETHQMKKLQQSTVK